MSIESAKAFYSRMTTDQVFRTQLQQAVTREERQQILQTAGYEFTAADWEAAKAQFQAQSSTNNELKDEELETIAGGTLAELFTDGTLPISPAAAYGVVLPPDELF